MNDKLTPPDAQAAAALRELQRLRSPGGASAKEPPHCPSCNCGEPILGRAPEPEAKPVKRWSVELPKRGRGCDMVEDPAGDWVLFRDLRPSPEPAAGQVLEYTDPDDGDLVTVCPTCGQAHCGLSRDILRQKLGLSETKDEKHG